MIFPIICAIIIALTALYVFNKTTSGKCNSRKDMSGKIVIVTGSNCGIGLETARDLTNRNARVILACRDVTKGEQAKSDIASSTGKRDNVRVMRLDLSSMQSVRDFAGQFLDTETRLDVLVNNAGVLTLPEKIVTEDGFGFVTATNYLGPFLLTNLLLPLMVQSAPSRIVNVSSEIHRFGKIDLDDVAGLRDRVNIIMETYKDTKLANCLMSLELSRRLKGQGVTSNSLHPGVVRSQLFRKCDSKTSLLSLVVNHFGKYFIKTARDGAQTSIYLAVSEQVEGVSGLYFRDCKAVSTASNANDAKMAQLLWKESAKLTGID